MNREWTKLLEKHSKENTFNLKLNEENSSLFQFKFHQIILLPFLVYLIVISHNNLKYFRVGLIYQNYNSINRPQRRKQLTVTDQQIRETDVSIVSIFTFLG